MALHPACSRLPGPLALILVLSWFACFAVGCEQKTRPGAVAERTDAEQTHVAAFQKTSNDAVKFERAIANAREFFDSLRSKVDPVALRRDHQMRGKKYFVEYLEAFLVYYDRGTNDEKDRIRDWLRPLVEVTQSDAYHALGAAGSRTFKQDINSYLGACRLLGRFGFDTTVYLENIRKLLPRILSSEHLDQRGVQNTMAITYLLESLEVGGAPDTCEQFARPGCVIRNHLDLTTVDFEAYEQLAYVYNLTHEIFFLTEFGAKPIQCVNEEDIAYIRTMHEQLIPIGISRQNPDVVGELLMDLNYLHMTDLAAYRQAIDYLFESQNPDGSWSNDSYIRYVRSVMRPEYLVDVGQYQHTTVVVLRALAGVFDPRPNIRLSRYQDASRKRRSCSSEG